MTLPQTNALAQIVKNRPKDVGFGKSTEVNLKSILLEARSFDQSKPPHLNQIVFVLSGDPCEVQGNRCHQI